MLKVKIPNLDFNGFQVCHVTNFIFLPRFNTIIWCYFGTLKHESMKHNYLMEMYGSVFLKTTSTLEVLVFIHILCYLLTMYCSFLCIHNRVRWMYMFVYTWYKLSLSVYWYVFVWKCKLCLPMFVRWTCVVLYICMKKCCIVHMFGRPQRR